MALDVKDFENINRHINFHRTRLEAASLTVRQSQDMRRFVDLRREKGGIVHSMFDPDRSNHGHDGAFWLEARDRRGQSVGLIATRLYTRGNMRQLLQSRQIWMDAAPVLDDMPPFPFADDIPALEGRIAVTGGLFVDSAWRGVRLGLHMVRLLRAVSLRFWFQDWNCGLINDSINSGKVQKWGYGYPNTATIFDGAENRPSWGPYHDREHLNWMSQADMLAEFERDPAELLPEVRPVAAE